VIKDKLYGIMYGIFLTNCMIKFTIEAIDMRFTTNLKVTEPFMPDFFKSFFVLRLFCVKKIRAGMVMNRNGMVI